VLNGSYSVSRIRGQTTGQLLLIDAILTVPETSPEKELQRRIAAIHAVTAYCGVEEGRSYLHVRRGRPAAGGVPTIVKAEEQARSEFDVLPSQAILSVMSDKRPTKCFLYLGNPQLSIRERIRDYATLVLSAGTFTTDTSRSCQRSSKLTVAFAISGFCIG
jgi:hypothetical protein